MYEQMPPPQPQARMTFVQEGAWLTMFATKKFVRLLAGQRDVQEWGEEGDAQRAALRACLVSWCGKPYRVTTTCIRGQWWVNALKRLHEEHASEGQAKRIKLM